MAMNYQRFALIVVISNLLFGIVTEIYNNPTGYIDSDYLSKEISVYEDYEQEYYSEKGVWGSVKQTINDLWDATIGNAITWGKVLIGIFLNSINPFSINPTQFNHPFEKMFSMALIFYRSIFSVVGLIIAYFIFKNKGSS